MGGYWPSSFLLGDIFFHIFVPFSTCRGHTAHGRSHKSGIAVWPRHIENGTKI